MLSMKWKVSLDPVDSVRWSPNGELFASASSDQMVKLVDFTAGKVIHQERTSDASKIVYWKISHNGLF